MYFNTSHVSINLLSRFWFRSCRCISIHLMFLLISLAGSKKSCSTDISIHLMFLLISRQAYIPNSRIFISIHLMFLLISNCWKRSTIGIHFNTSHVSINHWTESNLQHCGYNFNTSHVSINRVRTGADNRVCGISIHLMFLLILVPLERCATITSISIHLMFLLIFDSYRGKGRRIRQFQYISCFY